VHELGIIEMPLAGSSLGGWGEETTRRNMACNITQVIDAVWNFQNETGRIHGDCHLGNVLSPVDMLSSYQVIDLERSLKLEAVRVRAENTVHLALRLVDVMKLLKGFFHRVELLNGTHAIEHRNILQCVGKKLQPFYATLDDVVFRKLKAEFNQLFGSLQQDDSYESTMLVQYRSDVFKYKQCYENITGGKWFQRDDVDPLLFNITSSSFLPPKLTFSQIIVFSKTNQFLFQF